ncbi:MAG TPA: hypothetical protein VN739_06880 [Nitrososphaerales archaeon]|nr:hypothetical protein [Nitrososphaerales archaeon]
MEVRIGKSDYIAFFRLSEAVLQDLLPILPDEEIVSLVSNSNWVALPMSGETSKEEIENRPDAHIDLRLDGATVRIGLRCNTVSSVEKLQNILEDYHSREKGTLLEAMKGLDGDFQTIVYAKVKEHNWSERANYDSRFQLQTNKIDETAIDLMFERAKQIRTEGIDRMRDENKPYNPVTPVIDVAFSTIARDDEQLFKSKLSQLKPMYETCFKVKTATALKAELRRKPKTREVMYCCPKCGKNYSKDEARSKRFCDDDWMKIRAIFINN